MKLKFRLIALFAILGLTASALAVMNVNNGRYDSILVVPAPGDVRILITRQYGKPVAVIFRPKALGFDRKPVILSSPTGQDTFDMIELVERFCLAYTKIPSGFKAVATIPLDAIGCRPTPGSTMRIDLGYILGNLTVAQATLRSYWSNTGFSADVVDDVPNKSRLESSFWGTSAVE